MQLPQLRAFLLAAKRAAYAAESPPAVSPPLLPGSTQLEYHAGDYLYRDCFVGGASFAGQEIAYWRGAPVWSLSYAGAAAPRIPAAGVEAIYAFLRWALRQAPADAPFRGPREIQGVTYAYRHEWHGGLAQVWGAEQISQDGGEVYALRYAGGLLR